MCFYLISLIFMFVSQVSLVISMYFCNLFSIKLFFTSSHHSVDFQLQERQISENVALYRGSSFADLFLVQT
jgi:hypothetical protein